MSVRTYKERRAAHVCARCLAPLDPDYPRVLCAECRAKSREIYRDRRARGLCVVCGETAMAGKCRCLTCARIASRTAQACARRKKAGQK